MHVITTSSSLIYFVPRAFETSVTLTLTDEETNITTTEALTATEDGNFLKITPTHTFVENRYYTFRVTGTRELYRGKIFVTNQSNLEIWSINNGQFVYFNDSDNDDQYIYR